MNLETKLSDPAFDLPVPSDALAQVHRHAARMRRRRRAAVAVPVVAALAIGVPLLSGSGHERKATLFGTAGIGPTREPANQQLQTFCVLPAGGALDGPTDLIGPTGDPVDNCARFWRYARHTDPPALVAYQDVYNNVYVQVQSEALPAGARALPAGAVQDAEAIELAEALGDPIELGPDNCRDEQSALAEARQVSAALGFADWPVRVNPEHADTAVGQCWASGPSLARHVISVGSVGTGFDFPPVLEQIARPLRASLAQCWSRAKALSEVQAAIARSSLSAEFKALVDVRQVDVPSKSCTTVRMNAGGGIDITLRGPA